MVGKPVVGAGFKKTGKVARIWVEVRNWPAEKVREAFGINKKLVENALGMPYEEFLKRYPHLYSTGSGYLLDDSDEKRIFNVDYLADYSTDKEYHTTDKFTAEELRQAVDEFLEVARRIYEALKSIPTESYEKVAEFEPLEE